MLLFCTDSSSNGAIKPIPTGRNVQRACRVSHRPSSVRVRPFYYKDHPFLSIHSDLCEILNHRVLTFGSYEMYKKALLNRFPNTKPVLLYAFSAVLGDLTGSGWLCPSEVIKQQTQAGMYKSTAEAFRGILSKKGIKGLYEGYFGGIARDVPFRVAQLTSYEVTKNFYLRIKSQRMKSKSNSEKGKPKIEKVVLSPHEAAFCGAVAGTFSAAITAPLDRFKTLLMTDSAAYGGTVLSCAAKIWREEGIAGFATGIVPRVSYIAPSVAIFFIVYEQVRQRLDY